MKLLFIIPIILAVVFLPIPVFASCATPPIIGVEFYNFDRAHTVFVGTVTDIYNPILKSTQVLKSMTP